VLNYSKEQYDKDRKNIRDINKLDELFVKWEKVSKKCSLTGIINPPQSLKDQVVKNRHTEFTLSEQMKSLKKKKILDLKEIKD